MKFNIWKLLFLGLLANQIFLFFNFHKPTQPSCTQTKETLNILPQEEISSTTADSFQTAIKAANPNPINTIPEETRSVKTTPEELRIGYCITIHKEIEMFKALLRAIYDPKNVYFINVDGKAEIEYFLEVQRFVANMTNVHINENRFSIVYGGVSYLMTVITSYMELKRMNYTVDFFINLSGQVYPLKTKAEIKQFLSKNRQRNFIGHLPNDNAFQRQQRMRSEWRERLWIESDNKIVPIEACRDGCGFLRRNVPLWLTKWESCLGYVMLNNEFMDWIISSPKMWELLSFDSTTFAPEEQFWATAIVHSPFKDTMWPDHYQWATWQNPCCSGSISNSHPCVLGVCNIPVLMKAHALFAYKVSLAWDEGQFVSEINKILADRERQEQRTGVIAEVPLNRDTNLVHVKPMIQTFNLTQ